MSAVKDADQKERELDAENKFFFKMEIAGSTETLNEVIYAGMNIVKSLEICCKCSYQFTLYESL